MMTVIFPTRLALTGLVLALCIAVPAGAARAATACATSPASLHGWYGMLVAGTEVGGSSAKYQVGAALFDGVGAVSISHLYGSGGISVTAGGTYLQNADCTFTVSITGAAAGTYTVALNSAGEAVGIETDSTAVANVSFKPQFPTYVPVQYFNASSLNGTYSASCSGPQVESSDLNLVTFKNGSLAGTDPYNNGGGFGIANVPYTGTYTVNTDGTFAGSLVVLGNSFDYYGVVGESGTEVDYLYTNVSAGVATNAFASCSGKVAPSAATVVNLASHYNTNAVASNGVAPGNGGFAGSGTAYSANLLGSSLTWNGLAFPVGPPNLADAVAGGTVTLPSGNYSTLYLIGTAVYGPQTGTIVVTYTDGTTSVFTQGFSDWGLSYNGHYAANTNEAIVTSMPYRVVGGSAPHVENGPWYIYGYAFALNNAKTLKSVTLPGTNDIIILSAVVTP